MAWVGIPHIGTEDPCSLELLKRSLVGSMEVIASLGGGGGFTSFQGLQRVMTIMTAVEATCSTACKQLGSEAIAPRPA